MVFQDRVDAGRRLAEEVSRLGLDDPVVLALPRGGVPVAAEVAARESEELRRRVVHYRGARALPVLAGRHVVLVDDVVCAEAPAELFAVGQWWEDFSQTADDEVVDLLARIRAVPEESGAAV